MTEEIRRRRSRTNKASGSNSGKSGNKKNLPKKGNGAAPKNNNSANKENADNPNSKIKAPSSGKTRLSVNSKLEQRDNNKRNSKQKNNSSNNVRSERILQNALFLAKREKVDRKMIIKEENNITQVVVLEDDVLVEHFVSEDNDNYIAGAIFYGKVQNVLPSMEAAFVDIGTSRNGVLYAGEVNYDIADVNSAEVETIDEALKVGEKVLVQVTKEPFGKKGSRLTSEITLSGRYVILSPNRKILGISRRLPDKEKIRIKKIIRSVLPENMGVIVRTVAEGASYEDFKNDLDHLLNEWKDIQKQIKTVSVPAKVYSEPKIEKKIVRDYFNNTFSELVISASDKTYNDIYNYISATSPDLKDKVVKASSGTDIFKTMRIGEQISKALSRVVHLPSGGSLVIDRTEAMTVIDVNTSKFTGIKGQSLEETVTANNLEAAQEIVNQMRIRDLSGIIVVDFIDMIIEENRDLVLKRLVECLSRDRTIHQVTEITSLGLVQITRKRVGRGLLEVFSEICQNCHGEGHIINTKGDSIPEPILSSSVVETSEEIKDSLKEIFLAAKVADTSDEEYENNNDDNDDDDSDDNDDIANDEIDDNLESETDDEFDEEN